MPRMIQQTKTKTLPGRPKKSEKVKLLSKLFFQLPIWRQKSRFDNKAANFPPQIRHFLAQSRNLFHKVNLMFLSKCFSGHVNFVFDNFIEKFRKSRKNLRSNTILNWKKTFWKKNHRKFLGRLECNFDKIDGTFFSELSFSFARTRSQMKHDKIVQKKSKSYLNE